MMQSSYSIWWNLHNQPDHIFTENWTLNYLHVMQLYTRCEYQVKHKSDQQEFYWSVTLVSQCQASFHHSILSNGHGSLACRYVFIWLIEMVEELLLYVICLDNVNATSWLHVRGIAKLVSLHNNHTLNVVPRSILVISLISYSSCFSCGKYNYLSLNFTHTRWQQHRNLVKNAAYNDHCKIRLEYSQLFIFDIHLFDFTGPKMGQALVYQFCSSDIWMKWDSFCLFYKRE